MDFKPPSDAVEVKDTFIPPEDAVEVKEQSPEPSNSFSEAVGQSPFKQSIPEPEHKTVAKNTIKDATEKQFAENPIFQPFNPNSEKNKQIYLNHLSSKGFNVLPDKLSEIAKQDDNINTESEAPAVTESEKTNAQYPFPLNIAKGIDDYIDNSAKSFTEGLKQVKKGATDVMSAGYTSPTLKQAFEKSGTGALNAVAGTAKSGFAVAGVVNPELMAFNAAVGTVKAVPDDYKATLVGLINPTFNTLSPKDRAAKFDEVIDAPFALASTMANELGYDLNDGSAGKAALEILNLLIPIGAHKLGTKEIKTSQDYKNIAPKIADQTATPEETKEFMDISKEIPEIKLPEIADKAKEVHETETKEGQVKVGDLLDKRVTWGNKKGNLIQNGQTIEFLPEGTNIIQEIGNIDELKDKPANEVGIGQEQSVVDTNDKGDLVIRGKSYSNEYSKPLEAITRDKDGNVVSVRLNDTKGQPKTFRGSIADDIAYQLTLKEGNKPVAETPELLQAHKELDDFNGAKANTPEGQQVIEEGKQKAQDNVNELTKNHVLGIVGESAGKAEENNNVERVKGLQEDLKANADKPAVAEAIQKQIDEIPVPESKVEEVAPVTNEVSKTETPVNTEEAPTEKKYNNQTELKVETKLSGKFNRLADKIEKGKLGDDLMLGTIPFAKEAINGAISAAAKIIRAGGKLADAIDEAIKYLKSTDAYKSLTDKEKINKVEKFVTDHITSLHKEETESKLHAAKNATMQEAREERGANEVKKDLYIGREEISKQAEQKEKEGYNVTNLINEINGVKLKGADGKEIKNETAKGIDLRVQQALILRHHIDLSIERRRFTEQVEKGVAENNPALKDEALSNSELIDFQMDAAETALAKMGTQWSEFGNYRREMLADDFSYANVLRQATIANEGRKLSHEERTKFEKLVNDYQEKLEKATQAEKEYNNLIEKQNAENVIEQQQKQQKEPTRLQKIQIKKKSILDEWKQDRIADKTIRNSPIPLRDKDLIFAGKYAKALIEEGVVRTKELTEKIIKDVKTSLGIEITKEDVDKILNTEVDGKKLSDDLSEGKKLKRDKIIEGIGKEEKDYVTTKSFSKNVKEIVNTYLNDGLTSEDIIYRVHNDLSDNIDGVTLRDIHDAITGYGRDKVTKSSANIELTNLKAQLKLASQIADAEKGIKTAKTPREKKAVDNTIERMKKTLNQLRKNNGWKAEENADAAIKRATERKDYLDKTLEDIKNGKLPEPPEKLEYPKDKAKELQKKKAEVEKVRLEIKAQINKLDYQKRHWLDKFRIGVQQAGRNIMLSNPQVYSTLVSWSLFKGTSQVLNMGLQEVLESKALGLKKFQEVSKKAAYEGKNGQWLAFNKATRELINNKGHLEEALRKFKTGHTDKGLASGFETNNKNPITEFERIANYVQNSHGAVKVPLQHMMHDYAKAKLEKYYSDLGEPDSPLIQAGANTIAMDAILMKDNAMASWWAQNIGMLENLKSDGSYTGNAKQVGARLGAFLLNFINPIVKIPSNMFKMAATEYNPVGLIRGADMIRRGAENLTPEEADTAVRLCKNGLVGTAITMVYLASLVSGGRDEDEKKVGSFYYKGRQKEGDNDIAGRVNLLDNQTVAGKAINKGISHNPIAPNVMWMATTYDYVQKQDDPDAVVSNYLKGIITATTGMAEENPFWRGAKKLTEGDAAQFLKGRAGILGNVYDLFNPDE